MDNKQLASAIIDAVGGKDNISSVAHCATRLRMLVNEKDKVDVERIEGLERVKGTMFNAGQFQVILGTGLVDKVYDEAVKLVGESSGAAPVSEEGNVFRRSIRVFGDVFVPIIPVLVATGLFMGLRGLLTQDTVLGLFGMTPEDIPANLLLFTQILTDTAFSFLPALVCWSTFRVFGGSPVLGIVLGLMLVHPSLPNAYSVGAGTVEPLMFFGVIPVQGYQASVLPAFITGIVGAKLEGFLKQHIPDVVDLIFRPFLTLLGGVAAALLVIGPIFHTVELGVLAAVQFLIGLPFGIGGFIYGGLLPLLVVVGVHQILSFLEITLLAETGWDALNGLGNVNMAMAGAVLAVAIATKSQKQKQIAYPSALSASLGISEPAIFGVALPMIYPFGMTMLGAGCASLVASLFNLRATGMGLSAIPGVLLYLNEQLPIYILVKAIAFSVAFVGTLVILKHKQAVEERAGSVDIEGDQALRVAVPARGKVIALSEVPDEVFASGKLGEGFAVEPEGDEVLSPVTGSVRYVAPTGHAIGFVTPSGAEVLMHMGLDTVELEGKPFSLKVRKGQTVRKGEPIGTMDVAAVRAAGKNPVIIVVAPDTHIQQEVVVA